MAARGMSIEASIARVLSISERTLFNHLKENDSFREAWAEGVAQGVDIATSKLWALVESGNLAAVQFFLRAKGGFRVGAQEVNVVVQNNAPAPTVDLAALRAMAARQSYLLDHDPDDPDFVDVDFEIVEGLS